MIIVGNDNLGAVVRGPASQEEAILGWREASSLLLKEITAMFSNYLTPKPWSKRATRKRPRPASFERATQSLWFLLLCHYLQVTVLNCNKLMNENYINLPFVDLYLHYLLHSLL